MLTREQIATEPPDATHISARQLARRWNVFPFAIQKWAREGKLPGAYRDGLLWMFPPDVQPPPELEAMLATRARRAAAAASRR